MSEEAEMERSADEWEHLCLTVSPADLEKLKACMKLACDIDDEEFECFMSAIRAKWRH